MTYDVTIDDEAFRVELERQENGRWRCQVNGRAVEVDAALPERDVLSLIVGGRACEVERERPGSGRGDAAELQLVIRGRRYAAAVRDPRALRSRRARTAADDGPRPLAAPMPGKVVRVLAPAGTRVAAGQGIVVIEAMKMQNELKSPKAGVVQKLLVTEGAAVNAGDVLAVVE